jgi:hypothetical protein
VSTPSGNQLLDALSAECRKTVLSRSKHVALGVRSRLYWPGEMPQHALFLTSGIASVVATLNDGGSTEVGVIGSEGLTGAFHVIGPIPQMTECFMQVAGSGYRLPLAPFANSSSDMKKFADASWSLCRPTASPSARSRPAINSTKRNRASRDGCS